MDAILVQCKTSWSRGRLANDAHLQTLAAAVVTLLESHSSVKHVETLEDQVCSTELRLHPAPCVPTFRVPPGMQEAEMVSGKESWRAIAGQPYTMRGLSRRRERQKSSLIPEVLSTLPSLPSGRHGC